MESKFPVIPELNIQELKKSELILWISKFPDSLVYNLQSIDTLRAVLRKLRDRQQKDTQESDRLEDPGFNTSGQQSAVNDELGDQNKAASTIKLSALDTTTNNGEEQASDIPDNEGGNFFLVIPGIHTFHRIVSVAKNEARAFGSDTGFYSYEGFR
ncbi:hypothetical protein QAD02_003022 [Eretmocerus hayati]|uniref:Uncharacterized protein n=1 Tax=Eretmocerus hayati TaxID=131215 RepID=A0ACC2NLS7_9HYME|nr:hypothetical protein QAD02_003022 [Eretmocerus hayati]